MWPCILQGDKGSPGETGLAGLPGLDGLPGSAGPPVSRSHSALTTALYTANQKTWQSVYI